MKFIKCLTDRYVTLEKGSIHKLRHVIDGKVYIHGTNMGYKAQYFKIVKVKIVEDI